MIYYWYCFSTKRLRSVPNCPKCCTNRVAGRLDGKNKAILGIYNGICTRLAGHLTIASVTEPTSARRQTQTQSQCKQEGPAIGSLRPWPHKPWQGVRQVAPGPCWVPCGDLLSQPVWEPGNSIQQLTEPDNSQISH